MKLSAPAILMGVLLASSVSMTTVGEVRAEEQAIQQYQVKIDGMTWPVGCAGRVRETLETIDGVEEAKIDFNTKTATVTMKAGKSLSQEACQEAFRGTGYSVASFK